MIQSICAEAHPNIALVKYWGKDDEEMNVPSSPSFSITLDHLVARTSIQPGSSGFRLNGELLTDPKVEVWKRLVIEQFALSDFSICTTTNFSIGSGLASSAAGFAALIKAVDAAFDLKLSERELSIWARRGSGSAARSIPGGFATMENMNGSWTARQLHPPGHWNLEVAIAVTSRQRKRVGSTEGMARCKATSIFFDSWIASGQRDFEEVTESLQTRDFARLARVAQSNCLRMHAVMLAARPSLLYWNPATIAVLDCLTLLQEAGVPVFYTMDAGPQVKAVCAQEFGTFVCERLRKVPGVLDVIHCGMGGGARIVDN